MYRRRFLQGLGWSGLGLGFGTLGWKRALAMDEESPKH